MKKLFLLFFFYSSFSFSQSPREEERVKIKPPGASEEMAREYTVKGSAYLNPDFQKGITLVNGQEHLKVNLRYNALRDNIEILHNNGNIEILRKSTDVGAKFDSNTFEYIDYFDYGNIKKGFFAIRNKGETKLYVRHKKTILYQYPENGYEVFVPPNFVLESQFYIKRGKREAQPLLNLSRKEVFAILWDKYSELRRYARKNKLQMRDEKEVIQVLLYYDSMKKEEKLEDGLEK